MRPYDVPDFNMEPPEPQEAKQWCDYCDNWRECSFGCGMGWCVKCYEFTEPDRHEECGDFDGDAPDTEDDPRIDTMREEG